MSVRNRIGTRPATWSRSSPIRGRTGSTDEPALGGGRRPAPAAGLAARTPTRRSPTTWSTRWRGLASDRGRQRPGRRAGGGVAAGAGGGVPRPPAADPVARHRPRGRRPSCGSWCARSRCTAARWSRNLMWDLRADVLAACEAPATLQRDAIRPGSRPCRSIDGDRLAAMPASTDAVGVGGVGRRPGLGVRPRGDRRRRPQLVAAAGGGLPAPRRAVRPPATACSPTRRPPRSPPCSGCANAPCAAGPAARIRALTAAAPAYTRVA